MSGLDRLEKLRALVVAELERLGIPTDPGYLHVAEPIPEESGQTHMHLADFQVQSLLAAFYQLDALIAEEKQTGTGSITEAILRGYDLACLLIQGGIGTLGKAAREGLVRTATGARSARKRHWKSTGRKLHNAQSIMDEICRENPGLTRSDAWAELAEATGAKRETLEKHGVTCPILSRKKRPPRI